MRRRANPLPFCRSRCWPPAKVRYAGEPVAVIVAETQAQALDAAELVKVDYRPLPAVTDAAAAKAPDAPQIADAAPGNLSFSWRTGDRAAVEAAFKAAAHIVELELDNHRIVTSPIEPRGIVGMWDEAGGRYTAYVSGQSIHATRDNAARALGVAPAQVRFVAPDVGGGFGAKNFIYPEHVLMLWAAQAHRPARQMDREPRRGFSRRPPGARPAGKGGIGARRRGAFPGVAGRQHRQSRRLPRQRRRRADLPVRAPARDGLPHPGDRIACRGRVHQYAADRRHARPGLCRGGQHHRAADRPRGPAMRLRPRRIAPTEPGPGGGDADDERLRQQGRQRRFPGDLREGAGHGRCRGLSRPAPRERGARHAARARLCLSHQGDRRLAARECRYPLRGGRRRCR